MNGILYRLRPILELETQGEASDMNRLGRRSPLRPLSQSSHGHDTAMNAAAGHTRYNGAERAVIMIEEKSYGSSEPLSALVEAGRGLCAAGE